MVVESLALNLGAIKCVWRIIGKVDISFSGFIRLLVIIG